MPTGDPQPADSRRSPMNVYTAMLLLSFVAMTIACVILGLELYTRSLPLRP